MTRDFPVLPPCSSPSFAWPGDVQEAYSEIQDIYASACRILSLDESDPHRLDAHANAVEDHGLALVDALSSILPDDWVDEARQNLKLLLTDLRKAEHTMQGVYVVPDTDQIFTDIDDENREILNLRTTNPVINLRTGRRGRPRKMVPKEFILEAFAKNRKISVPRLALSLGVGRDLINRIRSKLAIKRSYDGWSDDELDAFVRNVKQERPEIGLKYIWGRLRSLGVKIQRERIRMSIKRMDSVGLALRAQKTIRRRKYFVSRPNALWHADGYHKLIPWGIVIHGIVDGFC